MAELLARLEMKSSSFIPVGWIVPSGIGDLTRIISRIQNIWRCVKQAEGMNGCVRPNQRLPRRCIGEIRILHENHMGDFAFLSKSDVSHGMRKGDCQRRCENYKSQKHHECVTKTAPPEQHNSQQHKRERKHYRSG